MEEKGIWRTISGRRVFIKEGQNLTDAMKNSGKFNNDKNSLEALEKQKQNIYEELDKLREDAKKKYLEPEGEKYWKNYFAEQEQKGVYFFEDEELDNKRKLVNGMRSEQNEVLSNIDKSVRKKQDEFYKTRDKINAIRNAQNDIGRSKQLENFYSKHEEMMKEKFYSNDLKDVIDDMSYVSERENVPNLIKRLPAIKELDEVLKKEGLELSSSPYSFSLYGIKKGEEITWGSKPIGSYRLSDHWNFESRGTIHCKLTGESGYKTTLILARYNGETYDIVKEF